MGRYLLRRLFGLLLTLWAAATLTFVVGRLVPGDPVAAALADSNASPDVLALRREALGLDRPFLVQYAAYLSGAIRGDLGVSWYGGEPVWLAIAYRFPATLRLAASAMVVALGMGVGMGVLSAVYKGRLLGLVSSGLAGFTLATPLVISGPLLIYLFAIRFDWLPATGQGDLRHVVLPSLALGLSASGGIARVVSASLAETLRQRFVDVARAKGLGSAQVLGLHALPVALIPVLTVGALQFGYLLGGAVVTESLFARQGIGLLLVKAVLSKDLPVVRGVVLLSALIYSLLSFATDVLHASLDPRVRTQLARS